MPQAVMPQAVMPQAVTPHRVVMPQAVMLQADARLEDVRVGTRVEALYQGTWYAGRVVALPTADVDGRWTVQCDVDQEGTLTKTNRIKAIQVHGSTVQPAVIRSAAPRTVVQGATMVPAQTYTTAAAQVYRAAPAATTTTPLTPQRVVTVGGSQVVRPAATSPEGPVGPSGGQQALAAPPQRRDPDWSTAGEGHTLGGDTGVGASLSAAELRQRALEAAETRQDTVPGLSKEKVSQIREKQQKEELLGKIREHYNRKRLEMPIGLNAASADKLRKFWDAVKAEDPNAEQVLDA
jgi:hypothetical protein